MPKRKRGDDEEDSISRIPDQALRIQVSRLKARFDHGVVQLTAQLKLARGFDRQKMTRRMTQAGKDKVKLERLQAEVEVLKDINEGKIARNYLLKQCVRTKRIEETDVFRQLFGDDAQKKVRSLASTAEGNVLGRLFKSGPVNEVLPTIMKGIREIVGADKPKTQAVDSRQSNGQTGKPNIAEDEFEGFSNDAESGDEDDTNQEENETLGAYDDRLAPSSDEDEERPSNISGQDHDRELDPMEITDEEASEAEVDDQEDKEDLLDQRDGSRKKLSVLDAKGTSFLPTLMHGGYYSGSESDAEDYNTGYDPDKAYTAATKQQRKNRRGQRERQAIAEKKFGAKAKHLLKAKGAEGVHADRQRLLANGTNKNAGWDPRRGAVESSDRKAGKNGVWEGRKHERLDRRQASSRGDQNGRAAYKTSKHAAGTEKLHPSWEAARKKKMESANVGASSFAGKKITFD